MKKPTGGPSPIGFSMASLRVQMTPATMATTNRNAAQTTRVLRLRVRLIAGLLRALATLRLPTSGFRTIAETERFNLFVSSAAGGTAVHAAS